MVRCWSKNGHQKEIGVRAQNMLSIQAQYSAWSEELIWTLNEHEIFTLIMNKIYIWTPRLWDKWIWAQSGSTNHLALIACCIFYKKWVHTTNITLLSNYMMVSFQKKSLRLINSDNLRMFVEKSIVHNLIAPQKWRISNIWRIMLIWSLVPWSQNTTNKVV